MLDIQFELSIECSEKSSSDWEQSSQFHSVWVLIGLEVSPHCTVVAQHPGHPGKLWDYFRKFGKLLRKLWDSFETTFTHLLYTLFGLEISLHNCGATTWTFSSTGLTAHLDKRQQMINFCTIPNVLSCFKITSVCPEFYFHFHK